MVPELFRILNSARLSVLGPLLFGGAVCRGPSSSNRVALTFDDGPDPDATPAIAEALERAGARGTFFFLAPSIEAHPDLARRVAERHEVGTHLYSHDRETTRRRESFEADARRAIAVHEAILGKRPSALRFPFGEPGRVRPADVRALGLVAYHWTFSSEDSSAAHEDAIVSHVAPRLHGGAIVLFHDGRGPGSRKGTGSRRPTVRAIPRVLEALQARGLVATTVADLFDAP